MQPPGFCFKESVRLVSPWLAPSWHECVVLRRTWCAACRHMGDRTWARRWRCSCSWGRAARRRSRTASTTRRPPSTRAPYIARAITHKVTPARSTPPPASVLSARHRGHHVGVARFVSVFVFPNFSCYGLKVSLPGHKIQKKIIKSCHQMTCVNVKRTSNERPCLFSSRSSIFNL